MLRNRYRASAPISYALERNGESRFCETLRKVRGRSGTYLRNRYRASAPISYALERNGESRFCGPLRKVRGRSEPTSEIAIALPLPSPTHWRGTARAVSAKLSEKFEDARNLPPKSLSRFRSHLLRIGEERREPFLRTFRKVRGRSGTYLRNRYRASATTREGNADAITGRQAQHFLHSRTPRLLR
ncbi:hypothetical protein J3R74_003222 [Puniceicoccus vermicola]